ncbi:SGNH/GDSL hydrolase family protein [Catellatospora citrea]|uniref:Lipase n=1 Tax=Catellatospora citrea TaxID=53366 RepID=A0A8J3P3I9_9ACTN|nr:SGNH/GDSL hydrolase family protein [Catellatospora citrea]RKE11597.1 lysophospholipase L1-like esterase [Catellatospora citrea]GIG02402.1 lipase [Catellatospora citrea]
MIFQPRQRIVFIGDSITDCGRRDAAAPYGDGYMSLVQAFVTAARPELGLSWVNRGVSGDTVRDLAARWERDVVEERPDWLSVKIGINDVWRFFENQLDAAVPLDEYTATLRSLLATAVERTGCRLILADPYLIESDRDDPQYAMTADYAAVVATLAKDFGALHVPVQAAFDRVLASTVPADWAHDRIHPNLAGHAVIARAFLDVIG